MANSDRLNWPFPDQGENPFYETFKDMVSAQDATGYASREDRSLFLVSTGDISWNSSTNQLTFSSPLNIVSSIAGYLLTVPATAYTVLANQFFYANVVRFPLGGQTVTPTSVNAIPNTDNAYAIGVRIGMQFFFRNGAIYNNGDNKPLWPTGTGSSATIQTVVNYTITGSEANSGLDFFIPIGATLSSAGYDIFPAPKGVVSLPVWDFPNGVGDRTTSSFRIKLAEALTPGDSMVFYLFQP